jgi:beta-alanine degradation protein BauB
MELTPLAFSGVVLHTRWRLERNCPMAQPKPQPMTRRDPVTVDPDHYRVESEDDQVRILRIHYPAKAKSVMHGHPASVAIFLTDGECRFTYPDGKTEDHKLKAGQTMVMPAMEHLPENTGTKAFDVILVELKK